LLFKELATGVTTCINYNEGKIKKIASAVDFIKKERRNKKMAKNI